MALYRHVRVEFWKDPKVLEEMTPEDKLFMLYLLTNPSTTQIGIYRLSKKQMAFELGYSVESISCMIDRFVNNYGVIRYNETTREVGIRSWGKYNFIRLGKPMVDCIEKELLQVEDKSMIEFVLERISNLTVREIYKSHLNINENIELEDDLTSRSTSRGQKEKQKQKENKNKKYIKEHKKDLYITSEGIDNRNSLDMGDNVYGKCNEPSKRSKHSRKYKIKDERDTKAPSEEELEFARQL